MTHRYLKTRDLFLTFLFLVLSGCASVDIAPNKNPEKQPTAPDHATDYTNDERVTIAVVGINDFHGHLFAKEQKLPDGQIVQSGGASTLASMIQHLKTEMQGRLLIVDAGDEWQGTIESNRTEGSRVVQFFNRLGVTVAAVGNHEFDFSIDVLKKRAKEAKYPYVASNIFEKKTGKRPNWPNVYPSRIFEVEGVKIGVVGVSTVQTPGTTRYEFVKHLDFLDAAKGVIDESTQLKQGGAQAVLVTAHAGTFCKDLNGDLKSWKTRSRDEKQGDCDANHEIAKLASDVGAQHLDGIIAGHTHQVIHHFLSDIPIIEAEAYNQYFNVIYYTFSKKTKKLIPELTRIEGLIPICDFYFEGTKHCDIRLLSKSVKSAPKMVQAVFHGQTVIRDTKIEKWLKPAWMEALKYRNQVVGYSDLPLMHARDQESALGNLVADVLQDKMKTDFSLVNSGGIRTSLDAGKITYDGIFRAFPFDNFVKTIDLSGRDLKLLYRIATAGNHGFIGFSGLVIEVKSLKSEGSKDLQKDDLNLDGRVELWEENRLLTIKKFDGSEIKDDQIYSIATFDFLLNGGDDLSWFMSRIKPGQIRKTQAGYCRDLVFQYLKKHPRINTTDQPLINPSKPRLIVQP